MKRQASTRTCSRTAKLQFFDQAARDGHERGWTVTFGKLEMFLGAP